MATPTWPTVRNVATQNPNPEVSVAAKLKLMTAPKVNGTAAVATTTDDRIEPDPEERAKNVQVFGIAYRREWYETRVRDIILKARQQGVHPALMTVAEGITIMGGIDWHTKKDRRTAARLLNLLVAEVAKLTARLTDD